MAWNLKASRKEYLTHTITMSFVFLLILGISILEHPYEPAEVKLIGLQNAVQVSFALLFAFFLLCGSWIFSNMKTKEQRIMFKMLPASYLEKFLVRYMYVLILWGIGVIVAFCLADMARILICEIAGIEWCQSGIPMFMRNFYTNDMINIEKTDLPALTVTANVWAVWVHSAYVLGGTFFRRKQFVFTSLTHFVLGMAVLWIFAKAADNTDKFQVLMSMEDMAYIASAILAALTVFNYWLSFRLFKRMQVINNKWVNV